jgi:hypothetical protein
VGRECGSVEYMRLGLLGARGHVGLSHAGEGGRVVRRLAQLISWTVRYR